MLKVYQFAMYSSGEVIAYANDDGCILVAANNKPEAMRLIEKYNEDLDDKFLFVKKVTNLYYNGKQARIIFEF